MKGKTTKKAEKAVKQLCLQNIDFVSNDSQRSCQTHKPFVKLFALILSLAPWEPELTDVRKTVNSQYCKCTPPAPLSRGEGCSLSRESTSSKETFLPRDTLWLLVGILV